MNRYKILLFLVFVLLQTVFTFSHVTAAEYGEVSIQHVPLCSPKTGVEPTLYGSIEYRFRIQNRSQSQARTVTIDMRQRHSSSPGLQNLVGTVEVPAGQSAQLSLILPPVQMADVTATVRIDGRTEKTPLSISIHTSHCDPYYSYRSGAMGHYPYVHSSSSGISNPSHIMVGRKCTTAFRDLFASGPSSTTSSSSPPAGTPTSLPGMPAPGMGMAVPVVPIPREIMIWGAESDADQWSDQWVAYTRFAAVVLEASEMETVPGSTPVGKALHRYVETGGTLCVLGASWEAPQEWTEVHSSSDYTQWNAGLGNVYLLKKSAESSEDAVEMVRKRLFSRVDAWCNAMQMDTGAFSNTRQLSTSSLPVSASVGVPIRWISVLIVIFAILIGPVNVYVLSLKNRRIWLLWTVPVISLIASGLVLGTNILREGFIRNTSISSATILDQRQGEAISLGVLGFYSTFTPSGGLVFESGTEVIPMTERSIARGNIVSYPGGEQNWVSGWVQARVPTYFAFRKAAPDIRRLEFQWEQNNPTVVNHLGVDLKDFVVCSPEKDFYEVNNIAAGEKVTLKKSTKFATSSSSSMQAIQGTDNMTVFMTTMRRFENWPTIGKAVSNFTPSPGSYHATIQGKDNPFIEPGISGMKSYENHSIIIGYF